MKCNNCGSEIEEGNDFCPICGVRILNNESSSLWQRVYHGKRMIFVSDGTEEIEYVILINGWLIKKD
jgi:DNA-directed RNA polymerase subunit RPC12/RpoP